MDIIPLDMSQLIDLIIGPIASLYFHCLPPVSSNGEDHAWMMQTTSEMIQQLFCNGKPILSLIEFMMKVSSLVPEDIPIRDGNAKLRLSHGRKTHI